MTQFDEPSGERVLGCSDRLDPSDTTWACVSYDGTGLWCDGCLEFHAIFSLLCATTPTGSSRSSDGD